MIKPNFLKWYAYYNGVLDTDLYKEFHEYAYSKMTELFDDAIRLSYVDFYEKYKWFDNCFPFASIQKKIIRDFIKSKNNIGIYEKHIIQFNFMFRELYNYVEIELDRKFYNKYLSWKIKPLKCYYHSNPINRAQIVLLYIRINSDELLKRYKYI